jgi:hypothetical protein
MITPNIPNLDNTISDNWFKYLSTVHQLVSRIESSGTTADRPTTNLWIGQQYFDTTLGKPVWLKSVKPSVWVLATGVVA